MKISDSDTHKSCACGHAHHGHDGGCTCGHAHHHTENATGTKLHGMKQRVYILENLGCANCAAKMEAQIAALDGVAEASITFATKQLRIQARHPDALLPQIRAICTGIESQVRVLVPAAEKPAHSPAHDTKERSELILLIIGALLFIAGIAMQRMGAGMLPMLAVCILAYLLLGGKILLEAARGMGSGRFFDENFLMSIATLGAFAIGEFAEAVGVMLFYRIGEYFEHRAVEKSRREIMQAVDLRPETVNRVAGDTIEEIPAADARPGDVLLIRPGDRIPLDGTIIDGESRIDTSPITGEPVPVGVKCGDEVLSGCVNTSGQLLLLAEKALGESMVSRILDSVENAAASKPKVERFITRFSRVYTPCVVLIALCTAVIPSLVTGNWNYWVYTALTFLVMSCPCALVLSVPLAFFSGIGAGSRKGILFKGGLSIEALGRIRAVVMDKTGTITKGNFALQAIEPAGDFSAEELLRICAGCEQHSTHPIAHSITAAAQNRGLSLNSPASMEEISGHGIEAVLEGRRVLCGNRKLMEKHGISVPGDTGHCGAEVFAAIDGSYAGRLVISDAIKPDAASAIRRLKSMGLHTAMLTGDSAASAEAVAHETGIDQAFSRLLPHEKVEKLTGLRRQYGAVLFVGDGINDAPVLAGADVGAAMGSGADAAIEAADAVFMTSAVESIPQAVQIARATSRIAIQNVVFALTVKIAVMILGLCGFANMWLAVFADTGVAMICVLNSIRALYRK